jgi:hypothetical protein
LALWEGGWRGPIPESVAGGRPGRVVRRGTFKGARADDTRTGGHFRKGNPTDAGRSGGRRIRSRIQWGPPIGRRHGTAEDVVGTQGPDETLALKAGREYRSTGFKAAARIRRPATPDGIRGSYPNVHRHPVDTRRII